MTTRAKDVVYLICFGARDGERARETARERFAWNARETRVVTLTRTPPIERDDDEIGAYVWRGDHKSAEDVRKLVRAVCAELERTNGARAVGVLRAGTGAPGPASEATRAVQTFMAFRRALSSEIEVAIALKRGAPPAKTSSLSANLSFNLVVARCPARRVFPSKQSRRRAEKDDGERDDADENRRASRAWHRELVRALRVFTHQTDGRVVVDDDNDDDDDGGVIVATARERWSFPDDPIQRLALGVADQLDDVGDRVRAFVAARDRDRDLALDDGAAVRLVPSSPERWSEGGYGALHYVSANPERRGVYYEVEIAASGARVGYIAARAIQSDPHADATYHPFSSPDFVFTTAQVERLCVVPEARRRGVKEILLRDVCDGFHALGLPVRIKTAKESVVASFRRCALLAFERIKDPKANGVRKTRGTKSVVVLPTTHSGATTTTSAPSRWSRDDDDERDYSNWRRDGDASGDDASATTKPTSAASKKKTKALDPVSSFTAALNRATPDSIERTVERVSAALEECHSASLGACADRLVAAAVAQTNYAMTYARCVAAIASLEFRDAVRVRATERLRSSDDASLVGAAEFVVELWRANVVLDDDFERLLFDDAFVDDDSPNFARVDVAFRALLRFGETLARRPATRAYARASEREGRERLAALGAPRRTLFLAEEVDEDAREGFQRAKRRGFGQPPTASSRVEAHDAARREMKSLVVSYDDGGEERAAILRGERKGWVFWYVGSPVTSHSLEDGAPSAYVFVPNDARGRRFVPTSSK